MARVIPPHKRPQFYGIASAAIILALLYFAQEVLVPLALALLFSFLLTPVVARVERLKVGRVVSALLVVFVCVAAIVGVGWTVERRVVQIVDKLPEYRDSIRAKFGRLSRSGGMVEKVREEIKQTIAETPATQPGASTQPSSTQPGPPVILPPLTPPNVVAAVPTVPAPVVRPTPDDPMPVRVYPRPATTFEMIGAYAGTLLGPLGTAGLVIVFVIFMLLGREDLRDRLIRLVGDGRLHVTTEALNDAATRITRFLFAQTIINTVFGVSVALGLWVIDLTLGGGQAGITTAIVAGLLCGILRFVPYVGIWIGAALPLGLSIAAYSGNSVFFATIIMFIATELIVSQAVEPHLLGSSTGLSPIAVLVSAVFWTWLWGPIGLLLSMPITVVLVVMGKYVPQLEFLDVMLGDTPVLDPQTRIYQRLIAGADEEANELAMEYLKDRPIEKVFDEILIPALATAESDWHRDKMDETRHAAVRQGLREIVECLGDRQAHLDGQAASSGVVREAQGENGSSTELPRPNESAPAPRSNLAIGASCRVLSLPAQDEADEIVAMMLSQALTRRGYTVTTPSANTLASEMVDLLNETKYDIVIVSALPPKAAIHARYLVKRLMTRHPSLKVIIGLWTNTREANVAQFSEFTSARVVTTLAAAEEQIAQITGNVVGMAMKSDDAKTAPSQPTLQS